MVVGTRLDWKLFKKKIIISSILPIIKVMDLIIKVVTKFTRIPFGQLNHQVYYKSVEAANFKSSQFALLMEGMTSESVAAIKTITLFLISARSVLESRAAVNQWWALPKIGDFTSTGCQVTKATLYGMRHWKMYRSLVRPQSMLKCMTSAGFPKDE